MTSRQAAQSTPVRGEPPRQSRKRASGRIDLPAFTIAALILWFATIHLRFWVQHPDQPVGLGLVALDIVQGALFFVRRRDTKRTPSFGVWLITMVGSWAGLAVRPQGAGFFQAPLLFSAQPLLGLHSVWMVLQLTGAVLAIISLSNLGRSFGLMPGNRGLRTGGAYRVVRHPTYASYLITDLGYLCENLSRWNLAIFCVVLVAQLWRIHNEEATLSKDPAYCIYKARVRYRILPGIY